MRKILIEYTNMLNKKLPGELQIDKSNVDNFLLNKDVNNMIDEMILRNELGSAYNNLIKKQ